MSCSLEKFLNEAQSGGSDPIIRALRAKGSGIVKIRTIDSEGCSAVIVNSPTVHREDIAGEPYREAPSPAPIVAPISHTGNERTLPWNDSPFTLADLHTDGLANFAEGVGPSRRQGGPYSGKHSPYPASPRRRSRRSTVIRNITPGQPWTGPAVWKEPLMPPGGLREVVGDTTPPPALEGHPGLSQGFLEQVLPLVGEEIYFRGAPDQLRRPPTRDHVTAKRDRTNTAGLEVHDRVHPRTNLAIQDPVEQRWLLGEVAIGWQPWVDESVTERYLEFPNWALESPQEFWESVKEGVEESTPWWDSEPEERVDICVIGTPSGEISSFADQQMT